MTWLTAEQPGGSDVGADGLVSDELVAAYREYGFVRVRGVLDPGQVERFRTSAEAFLVAHRAESLEKQGAFTQLVSVWQRDDTLRALTFDSRLGRIAEQLAGFPLRLWHDQMLVKEPHNNIATEFHQDRPYWPHAGDRLPLSAWIALVDVPPERGCMTFLPGTQHRTGCARRTSITRTTCSHWTRRCAGSPASPCRCGPIAATPDTWPCPTAPTWPDLPT